MIRKDGIYYNQYKGKNQYNEYIEIISILYFTKNNSVLFISDDEGAINPEQIPSEFFDLDYGVELTHELGKYNLFGNKINITYPLFDISRIDNEYQEFEGEVNGNNLVLNHIICNWNETYETYKRNTINTNQKFTFYLFSDKKIDIRIPEIKSSSFEKFDSTISNIPESKINEIKAFNKNRNGAIAFFFGFVGSLIGAVSGGFLGFFIGAIIGIITGFILKSIID